MGSRVVVNTKFTENANLKLTGDGIYDEIETNMVDLVQRGLSECNMVAPEYKELGHSVKCSPEFVDFQSSPVLFCWCSGSDFESKEMGGNSGKIINGYESFYCYIYYGVTGRDGIEMHRGVRAIADSIKTAVIKNLNLNDLMDGPSEFVSVEFQNKPVRFNKQIVPMNGITFKVIYRRGMTINTYSNPGVPNF